MQHSSAMNGLHAGDHVCALYESEDEQLTIAADYVAHGLRRGERCLYVGDSKRSLDRMCERLDARGIASHELVRTGALLLRTTSAAHLIDGYFDSERMLRLLNDAVEQALNDGFVGLRTCGDMSWLLDDAPGSGQVLEYEAMLSQFFQSVRAVGMCQYDRSRLPTGLLDHALATHNCVVLDGVLKANPFVDLAARPNRTAPPARFEAKLAELRRS